MLSLDLSKTPVLTDPLFDKKTALPAGLIPIEVKSPPSAVNAPPIAKYLAVPIGSSVVYLTISLMFWALERLTAIHAASINILFFIILIEFYFPPLLELLDLPPPDDLLEDLEEPLLDLAELDDLELDDLADELDLLRELDDDLAFDDLVLDEERAFVGLDRVLEDLCVVELLEFVRLLRDDVFDLEALLLLLFERKFLSSLAPFLRVVKSRFDVCLIP